MSHFILAVKIAFTKSTKPACLGQQACAWGRNPHEGEDLCALLPAAKGQPLLSTAGARM
jgi:hypothetical protein